MQSVLDFEKKQILVVFFNEGEKLSISNENVIVKKQDGTVKLQCTCYRLFIIFAVGHSSFTSAVIQKARQFGFFLALMTPGFRLYAVIGAEKDGNTLLHRKQYAYEGLDIAKHLILNKVNNQIDELNKIREKNDSQKEAIRVMRQYLPKITAVDSLAELMAYEGLSAKIYFSNFFTNVEWHGRQPRIKRDYVNASLDIGYSILFTFIDTLLSSFGFDTYCGVMHRQFYMRKSLVCDLVEPFRPLVDHTLKRAIGLKQITEEDFTLTNAQMRLEWKQSAKVMALFLEPLLERKNDLYIYVQSYYRAFMKGLPAEQFPVFEGGS